MCAICESYEIVAASKKKKKCDVQYRFEPPPLDDESQLKPPRTTTARHNQGKRKTVPYLNWFRRWAVFILRESSFSIIRLSQPSLYKIRAEGPLIIANNEEGQKFKALDAY